MTTSVSASTPRDRASDIRLGVVMDPIQRINIKKDSSFAMLLAAQARGWAISYLEQSDLFVSDAEVMGSMRSLTVQEDPQNWFTLGEAETRPLHELDVILMRKDPPFDMDYIYTTYLLEEAEKRGTLIVNKPQTLRDANEKLSTLWFPQCCPPHLVSSQAQQIKAFLATHKDIILKPLGAMGGASIFRVKQDDPNINVIIETLTEHGRHLIMAQRFIPEISEGDKRILLIEGKPVPYALARIPTGGETRGNLAAGGRSEGRPLTERDYWICEQVGATLRERGLMFVGLDVIGDYLTEINVTSPTCIRELDAEFGLNIADDLMQSIQDTIALGSNK